MTQTIGIRQARASVTRPVVEDHMNIEVVYEAHRDRTISTDEFRSICIRQIEQSAGRNPVKIKFISDLQSKRTKDQILFSTNNYFMAGLGLKV